MATITIIGAGNMGGAIFAVATKAGASVQLLGRDLAKVATVNPGATAGVTGDPITGDIVVLAVPYPAVAEVLATYAGQLDGKVLVDLTNPVNMGTFDSLVVPVDSSAAQEIAAAVPGATVLKAFNTNFAGTIATGLTGTEKTSVLIAGDDAEAKAALAAILEAGGLSAVDAGSLKRAHELEALGFLQMTLAVGGKTSWMGGFTLAS